MLQKNILKATHIPGNKAELYTRTEQRLDTDTAPTAYEMQTQLNVSIYVSPLMVSTPCRGGGACEFQ